MSRIPRSIRIIVGLILLFALSVPLSQAFMRWHMSRVAQELKDLATQLGYKQEDLLLRSFSSRDPGLGLPINVWCDVEMFYATQLTAEQFTTRVHQMAPATRSEHPGPQPSLLLYDVIPLAIKGVAIGGPNKYLNLKRIPVYGWTTNEDLSSRPIFIYFYDLENTPASFEYGGRPFQVNVVRLYKNGGNWPIWFNCPFETIEGSPQPN